MKIHLVRPSKLLAVSCAAACGMLLVSNEAHSRVACSNTQVGLASRIEIDHALGDFGSKLLAVGRVDSVSPQHGVEILGRIVQATASENLQVGDYAAIVDWSSKGSRVQALEVRPIAHRYVPGVSEVFLKATVQFASPLVARLRLGKIEVDYSTSLIEVGDTSSLLGSVLAVRGPQPGPGGVVQGACISLASDMVDAARADSPDGSLGTGRADGSLGTGRADGSLGTGKSR